MRRVAQAIRISPEAEAEYIRYHQQVWPEVLQTVADCNIRNYSIFLLHGVLIGYFEYHGDDYAADMRKMAACPHTQRWWSIMDGMLFPMADAAPGEKWSPMREVFYFCPSAVPTAQMERAH